MARRSKNHLTASTIPEGQNIFTSPDEHLDISMLETWLWDAACAIRGSTDAPKFKDFILPLVFSNGSLMYLMTNSLLMRRNTAMRLWPGRSSRLTLLMHSRPGASP